VAAHTKKIKLKSIGERIIRNQVFKAFRKPHCDTDLSSTDFLRHFLRNSPTLLLLKVVHRDVKLDEVAKSLACPRPGCRHVGVRLAIIRADDVSAFVGGMP
jgi:hypothetical protein